METANALTVSQVEAEPNERPSEAATYYKLSADQGKDRAQAKYGFFLENGKRLQQDVAEAVKHDRLSVDQGEGTRLYSYDLRHRILWNRLFSGEREISGRLSPCEVVKSNFETWTRDLE
jgi:hypothetical protein